MRTARHVYNLRSRRAFSIVGRALTKAYVRDNARKHMAEAGRPVPTRYVDAYASDGAGIELPRARTWLLRANAPP